MWQNHAPLRLSPHSYLRVAMLFPELRSLLLTLAHTLPDEKFTILTKVGIWVGRQCMV